MDGFHFEPQIRAITIAEIISFLIVKTLKSEIIFSGLGELFSARLARSF